MQRRLLAVTAAALNSEEAKGRDGGLFTLYRGPEHATFGKALIDDCIPLFLWGFGTEIAGKTLGNLACAR